eukprot:jgi/Chlat1/9223/Chrsp99S08503
MAPPPWLSSVSVSSPRVSMLLCLLLLLAICVPCPAAAQLNTAPWPDASGYTDVSEKQAVWIRESDGCDAVIGRFSFTQPGQVFQNPNFAPFNATGSQTYYCTQPWQGVGLEASFQTRDFIPFDGVVGVWIGGVEIMRGFFPKGNYSTGDGSETRAVRWSIDRSVTQFYSQMLSKQTVKVCVVYDNSKNVYAPVLNATFTLRYYTTIEEGDVPATYAPVVRPISAASVAPWFTLSQGSTGSTTLTLPRNIVSASIEVIGSKSPLAPTADATLGRDKQVQVLVDGVTAGFAYVNFIEEDRLHEPLPLSYSVDITPLVGHLVDGRPHTFAFRNPQQKVLLLAGNLFIYVDRHATTTSGTLLESSASGPFQLVTTHPPDCNNGYGSCSDSTANSSVTLRGTVRSSAGLEYFNVTQVATLVQNQSSDFEYDCDSSDINLRIVQVVSRGNTPTRSTSAVRQEHVFATNYRSCSDMPCSYNGVAEDYYSYRRTQQGALLRLQYRATHASHSDVGRGYSPQYYGTPCDYSEENTSQFVFADFSAARCFTYNTTDTISTHDGTSTLSEDSAKYTTRQCPTAV